ncbi:hypothetical protein [Streptosporangium lutulentum]|uniref:Uncharacterized protein n=1 Tax=Streptosporangium lutulentum TaxID=1461250 RepID=A0ABT9QRS9_9ACTN|nr:hypothetical protein [Streptosporangium lutulentum]MDP9849443.1 hypothetical protein [Streptosporangium lutulentum]
MSFDPVVRLADVSRVRGDGPRAVPALRGVSLGVAAGPDASRRRHDGEIAPSPEVAR